MNGLHRLAMIGLVLAVGCHKTTYTQGPSTPLTKENPQYHHILVNLVEASKPIPIHELCPQGLDRVDIRQNFLTGLVGAVTGGIYTPEMTFVQCKSGVAFNVERDESGAIITATKMVGVEE